MANKTNKENKLSTAAWGAASSLICRPNNKTALDPGGEHASRPGDRANKATVRFTLSNDTRAATD